LRQNWRKNEQKQERKLQNWRKDEEIDEGVNDEDEGIDEGDDNFWIDWIPIWELGFLFF